MIKLVIIDVDDTLFLTEEACFHLENEAALKLGFPPMKRSAHKKNWGHNLETAILERIPGIDSDKFMSVQAELLPEYVKNGKLDALTPDNLSTLNKLKKKGLFLAILTSRTYNEVKHLLDPRHHLHGLIQEFFYKENSMFRKPDPRVFWEILSKFKVLPKEAVYVGDSTSDEECSKKAGIYFIASLESGLRKKAGFTNTDVFIEKFSDLGTAIEILNRL